MSDNTHATVNILKQIIIAFLFSKLYAYIISLKFMQPLEQNV